MRSHRGCKVAKKIYPTPTHYETGCVFNQKAQFYKILLDTAKVVTIKMHNSSQNSLSILISAFILGMATLNELIIACTDYCCLPFDPKIKDRVFFSKKAY